MFLLKNESSVSPSDINSSAIINGTNEFGISFSLKTLDIKQKVRCEYPESELSKRINNTI
jgi:hypothetical protein